MKKVWNWFKSIFTKVNSNNMSKKDELMEIVKNSELSKEDKDLWGQVSESLEKIKGPAIEDILSILKQNRFAIITLTDHIKKTFSNLENGEKVDVTEAKKQLDELLG